MADIVVPLYCVPIRLKGRRIAEKQTRRLRIRDAEGATLITKGNFHDILDDVGEQGLPRFHLFETRAEARSAQLLFEQEEKRLRGATSETEIAMLRDGEGVLAIFHKDRPVSAPDFELIDHRLSGEREIRGSWALTEAECETALSAPAGQGRPDLALAITAKLGSLPKELLRDLQIAMERVPGAYVGFVSVSPEDVRNDYRLEGVDPERLTDALIQPFIDRASAKAEMGEAHSEAVEATVERLLEAHPGLIRDGSDTPEP